MEARSAAARNGTSRGVLPASRCLRDLVPARRRADRPHHRPAGQLTPQGRLERAAEERAAVLERSVEESPAGKGMLGQDPAKKAVNRADRAPSNENRARLRSWRAALIDQPADLALIGQRMLLRRPRALARISSIFDRIRWRSSAAARSVNVSTRISVSGTCPRTRRSTTMCSIV